MFIKVKKTYKFNIYKLTVLYVLMKLNPGLLWQKLHSTIRGFFLLAHWI